MENNYEAGSGKKVALVANATWGIYNFRLNLIRTLIETGWEIVVIAPIDSYISYQQMFPGIKHVPLRYFSRSSANPWTNILLFLELLRIYKTENLDLVIHFTIKANIFGSFAAAWHKIPNISVVTGLGYSFLDGFLLRQIVRFLYKIAFRLPQKVVFENADDNLLFLQSRLIRPEQARTVSGCGIDTTYFRPPATEKSGSSASDGISFAYLGRFLYDKGLGELADAARLVKSRFPNCRFMLIGDPDPDNPSSIPARVFHNWISEGIFEYYPTTLDVRPFLSNADCIVLPSYREGLPKSLLEAMAMEKPVITTDTPGCRELVRDGENGFLVPVKSAGALAAAMESFCLLDHLTIRKMGVRGRQIARESYCDEKVTRQYLGIIAEVLGFSISTQQQTKEKTPEYPLTRAA